MKSISTLFRQLSLIVVLISAFSLSALSAVYEKVTTAPADWSGDYLIVYETGKVAFNGALTTLDATSNTVSVTIADNKIEATEAMKAAQFTINASGYIKSASGYYIGQTSNANGLKSNTSTTYTNTLSLNADGTVNVVSGGAYLRYNATSGQYRFRYYKSSSYKSQKAICLYKLATGGETETIPTISASNLSFGTLTESNTTQTLTVVGANLTDAITATLKTGTAFEVAGTLTKDGGDLTIKFIATTAGEYTDQITLTSGETTTTINVSAKLVKLEGNGTIENPYTCSDINILNNNPDFKDKYWVKGYIIGCLTNNQLETSTTETRLNLAFSDNTENVSSYIPVQLPDNPVRIALNLVDNPNLVGKEIMVYGTLEVYFSKPGVKSVTDYKIVCEDLTIESGTTHNVTEKIALSTLTIKSNRDEAGQVAVTSGSLTAQKVVVEKTIDASRWFFFSLPFDCNISDIVATYVNGGAELKYAPDPSTGDYVIAEYNGGWVELIGTSHTLKANQGYIIGHFGSGDVTVKFPSNGAQNISAPANATLEKTSDNGFNLIGLPYFQKVTNVGLNTMHVSIPNEDGTYTQEVCNAEIIASIAPFTSFFVQTEAENIEFTLGAQQNAAPRLDGRSNRASLHKAVVTLTDANGGADKTTIINNPSKTTDYEIGHDLTKLIGYAEIPQIYSLQGDEMLAFNSLAIDNSTVIPLGVYAHADGDYTFSLSEKSVGDLEGWELYDNETGKITRLANEGLTVNLAQGTHEGRFEIRLQQRISTDCDNTMGDMTTWTANGTLNINNLPADAVVYIYDAVGRMVYVANNNSTTFNYTFAARGVYNIVVRTAENSVSFKTIY